MYTLARESRSLVEQLNTRNFSIVKYNMKMTLKHLILANIPSSKLSKRSKVKEMKEMYEVERTQETVTPN